MAYSRDVRQEVKRLLVNEGRTPEAISEIMGGKPSAACIRNWAGEKDESGDDWFAQREAYEELLLEETSPGAIARKIHQKILNILDRQETDSKKADALVKYQGFMEKILHPRFRIAAMYQVLGDLVAYLHREHPGFITPEFIDALREFKKMLRGRLNH